MNTWADRLVRASGLSLLLAGLMVLASSGRCLADPDPADAQEKAKLEKKHQQLGREYVTAYQKRDLVGAAKLAKEALEVAVLLYPEKDYPAGHRQLAGSLNDLGFLLREQGEHGEARRYLERALKMRERLYPEKDYPAGHAEIAGTLHNLGRLFWEQGEYGEARRYHERSLKMRERLYPEKDYPNGHAEIVNSLNNLGGLLQAQREYGEARRYLERALKMRERLYPEKDYPNGHTEIANSLDYLGFLLRAKGEHVESRRYYERALKMYERLYPEKDYPNGHPQLAAILDNLGGLLEAHGDYGEARRCYERALKMRERLYPEKDYPNGHPQLASSLNTLGDLLKAQGEYGEARTYRERALKMYERHYPEKDYPNGHADLAINLGNLGGLLREQGEYGEARRYLERALKMFERLYPERDHPSGHLQLAGILHNLGGVLEAQREHSEARRYFERALKMYERLYPEKDYPNGHPDLAINLHNLGGLLEAHGEYGGARRYLERALKMRERLYPEKVYPDGHPQLAGGLNNLGGLLQALGEYGEARRYLERALKMYERLYPKEEYPNGHPYLAINLRNLGGLLEEQGEYGEARRCLERALKMHERLYPEKVYPNGHPQLAGSLHSLGLLFQAQGEYGEALSSHFKALQMEQRVALSVLVASSEAEGLNFLVPQSESRTAYLSCAARARTPPDEAAYRLLYGGRGVSLQMLRSRQAMLHAATDPDTSERVRRLLDLRRRLSRLLLSPAGTARLGEPTAADLTRQKENLERELIDRLPPLAREQAAAHSRPNDLAKHLPAQSAFIDLYRFRDLEPRKREWGQPGYFAFVLAPSGTVRTVGPLEGKPIEEALAKWHRDINAGLNSEAAEQLRRLLWEPLEKELPRGTTTVYLCPDGPLNALPWAALPGRDKGSVLLEDYALAVVPGGPFLLDQLQNPLKPSRPGALLAVGDVAYDNLPVPLKQATDLRPTRGPATGPKKLTWPALEGTGKELDQVLALAKAAKEPPEVVERRLAVAGTDRLLLDLPLARWAHLATHGFFAAPETEERKTLFREPLFAFGRGGDRVGAGARNPLVQTGLVLAGANKAERKSLEDDPGILTGEAIAGLDLAKMELAVLSACDTGLGEDTREAVLGLPRAFHLGGTRNVVASLWKVDDEATAALMALFYRNLWHHGQPPIEALRNAQLTLMRNPQEFAALAKERGPNFDKTVKRVEEAADPKTPKPKGTAPVKQWAAFVLSGPGR